MGRAKQQQIEAWERGFTCDENLNICTQCFNEEGINKFIQEHAESVKCSFCSSTKNTRACPLSLVIEHIITSLRYEWGDPNNEGLPYETREGGWQGEVLNTWDLFDTTGLDIINDKAKQYIISSFFDDMWCEREPYSLRVDHTFSLGWNQFTNFVKNKSRYMFLNAKNTDYNPNQHDEMNPIKILDVLGKIINKVNLIKTLDSTVPIYRVRIIETNQNLSTAKELGPPPHEFAVMPNRMSPSGIPMFYGAFDLDTAIQETYLTCPDKKKAIWGIFHPTKELLLIDLPEYSSIPSLFDEYKRENRSYLKFLNNFIQDFIQPITRDKFAHIEYVPTQIVTEYFRYIFKTLEGKPVDGIIYPSSKNKGKKAVVIFATSDQCIDSFPGKNFNMTNSILSLTEVNSKIL